MDTLKNMKFLRKLPTPEEVQQSIPLSKEGTAAKAKRDQEIADIFSGKDDRILLIIGPCSADREDAVLGSDRPPGACSGKGQGQGS